MDGVTKINRIKYLFIISFFIRNNKYINIYISINNKRFDSLFESHKTDFFSFYLQGNSRCLTSVITLQIETLIGQINKT